MKRSEINKAIKEFEILLQEKQIVLPPFCSLSPEDWESKGIECDEIRDNKLGWDVTDYEQGDFNKIGLVLITLRNGNYHNPKYKKIYAEKLIMKPEGQTSPCHFHYKKSEDIINCGGGNLILTLKNADEQGRVLDTEIVVSKDGCTVKLDPNEDLILKPGESCTIHPFLYHQLFVEEGTGTTIAREISEVSDDSKDNHYYYDNIVRYCSIEEDEMPYRLLCNEYPLRNI